MKMNYAVLGTNNLKASVQFYDALFAQTGPKQIFSTERMTYWQDEDASFTFAVAEPFDQQPATHGNGSMLGFKVGSSEDVTRLHKMVLELGGKSEGEPGQRGPLFSAYARDLDGNKISFYA
ncbi:VOC family protein [Lentilitoribacter sp. Alg239-R112]|uniref:VOC family protein n=1 Tax=Lentilitoribacter sp. Alg239-R112 TaxID=2305987 RepID=UPI0013A699BA|nr:VOC family protein [Lentilitoribacter sp. Alg239-R112]